MKNFNLKQWLIENKSGMYTKTSLKEGLDAGNAFADDSENREDLEEVNPTALGVGQAVADREMQKQDDENSDWVDNASMDVVAEVGEHSTEVKIEEWEVSILGKDYIIDADVDVDFHYEADDYEDHMVTSPGGYYVDNAIATITKLGVEEGDSYRDVNDPVYIKQIQDLINKDPKLNRKLEDEVADRVDWSNMDETVGYVMKTTPSDPAERSM
jgi:hypothetical protein